MTPLPPKPSLVQYAADALRDGIRKGEWVGRLPGERILSERLQISRPTLRQALDLLEREGLLRNEPGKRRVIQVDPDSRPRPEPRVVFLAPYPEQALEPFAIFEIEALRRKLTQANIPLEFQFARALRSRTPARQLADRVFSSPSAVWLLYRASRHAQAWFRRQGVPAVVMGSTYPEIGLPSVDVDFQATCRHATHRFLKRGHAADQLVLLIPEGDLAGTGDAVKGFLEAVGPAGEEQVAVHADQPADICRVIDRLFAKTWKRPTGLLIQRPIYAHAAAGHLMSSNGYRLPADVSMVVLDDGPSLSFMVPEPSRYTKDGEAFARKLFQLVEAALRGGRTPTPQIRILPDWVAGSTLGPPPTC